MAASNAVNATSTGIQTFTGTAFTGSTVTQYGVLVGGASNAVASTAVGSAGQVLQSSGAGVNPAYSTATFPSTATSTGTILRANGTNWVATTATYPTTTSANQILYSSSANVVAGLTSAANSIVLTDASSVPSLGTSLLNDFTFTTSTAGATRTLTVSNTNNSNTASHATVQTTTGGASAGDPAHTFTITGATSWTIGADNSASDAFVVAASTALGTTNVMSMATGGGVSCVLGDLDITRSSSGGTVKTTVSNTSNTASSNALDQITVAGTSAGDPFTTYTVTSGNSASVGVDNSDSDRFKVSYSTALGTTDTIIADATGGQYKGYGTNTAPAAGFLGQQITSGYVSGVSLTSTVAKTVTSISVTAGVWDITGICNVGFGTSGTACQLSISTVNNTLASNNGDDNAVLTHIAATYSNCTLVVPALRVLLSGTTTYYLVSSCVFTGTGTAAGRISAVRVG